MDAHGLSCLRSGDDGKDLVPELSSLCFARAAMNADGNLATSAESGKRSPFDGYGKARGRMVEEVYGGNGDSIVLSGLDAQRTLPSRGTKNLRIESLANPLGFFQSVKACRGQQNRIDLVLGQLAQAGVHVAAKLDCLDVGPHILQLRAATLAAGAHARAQGQSR